MKFLNSLSIGDIFRPAHPNQQSLNRRKLRRDKRYVLQKAFSQSPHTHICVEEKRYSDGFYALPPKTPVLDRGEPLPTVEEVLKFLSPRALKRVYAYRLLWNGDQSTLIMVNSTVKKLLTLMFVLGKQEYSVKELIALVSENYTRVLREKEPKNVAMFVTYHAKTLVRLGLVEQVVDDAPINEAIVEANLHEVV